MKLILAETHYWDSAPRVDSHHLALHLSRMGHEILYLSSPLSLLHFAQRRNWSHKWNRLVRYGGRGRMINERLRAVVPLTWAPVQAHAALDSDFLFRRMLRWTTPRLSRIVSRMDFAQPDALIIQSLFFAQLPELLRPCPVIYRMTDDFDAFPNMPQALVRAERELVPRADLVTVCSSVLIERAERLGAKRIELLPHGVDAELFSSVPASSSAKQERVVYVGAIDSWFHAECVAAAARSLPNAVFELAGPIGPSARLQSIQNLPNVRLVGPIPFANVPAFLHGAKVGIIPFHRTPLIEPVRPLKLFEYLAAGLNVVATRWKELDEIKAPAELVDTPEEFAAAVARALSAPVGEGGRRFAAENSWSARAEALEAMVVDLTR